MAEVASLRSLLIDELRDLLDAETQITRALPQFAQATETPMLRTAFEQHLKQTNRHIERLRQAIEALGEPVRSKRCDGMRGLITEGNSLVSSTPKGALRDAVMITSAQKVEHYEMAAYGTARTFAEVLGRADIARLLDDTLQEEKNTDHRLTEIAESSVNDRAASEWHQKISGIVEAAGTVGAAVGLAARQVRRAAKIAGLDRVDADQVAQTMNRTMDTAAETFSDAAGAAAAQARNATRQTMNAARSLAADAAGRTASGTRSNRSRGKSGGGRQSAASGGNGRSQKRRKAGRRK